MPWRIPLFRIWYSTTYSVLFFFLVILLAVTPAETIYQSINSRELQKPFVIGGVYVLTVLIVLLVYATRLYTNRTVLAAIPKPYIPIEDGEVGSMVRRIIVKALRRSAIVAWDSRPRDVQNEKKAEEEGASRPQTAERNHSTWRRRSHFRPSTIIPVSPESPPWGHISHPGWASPASPDLPNLQYWNVVTELPNLIEAKAVSLAPPDPAMEGQIPSIHNTPVLPDAQIVTLLQRPQTMGLRDYFSRLASYGLINPPCLGPKFLSQYEYARFSTQSLTEIEFRALMGVFADILNGMTELDPALIEEAHAEDAEPDAHSFVPSESLGNSGSPTTNEYYRTPALRRQSEYSDGFNGSESPQTLRTAPSLQRNFSSGAHTLPRTPSERSLCSGSVVIRHTQTSPSTILPNSSTSSLRSSLSVVRLRPDPHSGDLPY
ncbi:hypothetical protein CC78DRAFT_532992 [Lojkania enalia]|uniref:Defect at low temperature protein 1 n=1 Tax=Lojkania enalia TaxID=147567 RepID=A0A9P4K9J8_9PLEO|nr:hypothetical protein CC78DRAFT_532992 [Didymosphaeria enalia]